MCVNVASFNSNNWTVIKGESANVQKHENKEL